MHDNTADSPTVAMVRQFHEASVAHIADRPSVPPADVRRVRATLVVEEALELVQELLAGLPDAADHYMLLATLFADGVDGIPAEPCPARMAGESVDLEFVVDGALLNWGIPHLPVFEAKHRANLSRLVDGRPVLRDDGKVLKGPDFRSATEDILAIIRDAS